MEFVAIDRSKLPVEEHAAATDVERNLLHLHMAAEEFRYVVELYLFAHEKKRTGGEIHKMIAWMKSAGRNGAIVANGVYQAMQAINSSKAPTLEQMIDKAVRKQATKLFAAEFPNFESIRDAAAHPGEFSASERRLERHKLADPAVIEQSFFAPGTYLADQVTADGERLIYSSSVKGRLVSHELSFRKADVLAAVASHCSRAFYPARRSY